MKTIRLTAAQATVRFLAAQATEIDGRKVPLFAGVFAIFGHGNVAAMGEALYAAREVLPTYRSHNEQAMALSAIAFAKASRRRRMMACTSSIGPGATNMVTAAAVAHVNRLPVLLLPGDVFANRIPDPVLQQVESFGDGTVSANDCFRPVSRYFDRITRPEQIIPALTRAVSGVDRPGRMRTRDARLLPGRPGRGLRLPRILLRRTRPPSAPSRRPMRANSPTRSRRSTAPRSRWSSAAAACSIPRPRASCSPSARSAAFRSRRPRPANRRRRSTIRCTSARIGVTGTDAANRLAEEADVVLAVGTRLSDFMTGSWALFKNPNRRFIGLNTQPFDAAKHRALPLVADARAGLGALDAALGDWRAPAAWAEFAAQGEARMARDRRALSRADQRGDPDRRAGARRADARGQGQTTSSSAPREACPATCTNCGRRARRSAITWNTAIPAWAMRSPAASA